jgi:hypothetical protein
MKIQIRAIMEIPSVILQQTAVQAAIVKDIKANKK